MSILDDAIREHLELIRRRGATDTEVKRLEDEAFGPPTRPDEADFPESEEAQERSGAGVATESVVDDGSEEAVAHEDVTTLLPAEQAGEPEGVAESEPVVPEADEIFADDSIEPEGEAMAEPAEEAEPPVAEDEPVAEVHPVVEDAGPEAEEAPSEEMSAPVEEGTSLYDHTRDELDLELELDDEPPAEEPVAEEHDVAEPEGSRPLEPPIESLDTVEHPFPEEIVEGGEPHEEPPPADEHAVDEEADQPEDLEEEGTGEDVLADTPEFLKDAPEDDELWFEQGKPKDFDF